MKDIAEQTSRSSSHLACGASIAGKTAAVETIDQVITHSSVLTWVAGAFIHLYLTVLPNKAPGANASISVYLVLVRRIGKQ